MKMSSILIAMFAVIAAVPAVQAGTVDFDGNSSKEALSSLAASVGGLYPGYDIPLPQEPGVEPIPWQLPTCSDVSIQPWPFLCNPTPQIGPLDCSKPDHGSWWWSAVCDGSTPSFPDPTYLGDFDGIERKAPATKDLKKELAKLLLGYSDTHPGFAASVMPIFKDKTASVVYKNKVVYLMNGRTLVGMNFEKLLKDPSRPPLTSQAKGMGWDDIAVAAVLGCVFSDDCREDVANYVENLHDDEHDTYHNNHDGLNPDYEVNKKVN